MRMARDAVAVPQIPEKYSLRGEPECKIF